VEFYTKAGSPEKQKSGCLVLGVFNGKKLTLSGEQADGEAKLISKILKRGDLDEKAGSALMLPHLPGVAAERVLLVSLGAEKTFNAKAYRSAVTAAAKAVNAAGVTEASFGLLDVAVPECDMQWAARTLAIALGEAAYRFTAWKSQKDGKPVLQKAYVFTPDAKALAMVKAGFTEGDAIGEGMNLTRELGNMPANICTPTYLASQAKSLAKAHKLKVEVLERDDMESLGMGSMLSVGRGSVEPPKLIVLKYSGGKASDKPVVLVGKGVTFDTGGISLKPGAEMDEMKFDMCGAASVLGVMKALALMQLPINVVGVIPATENMPSGSATKPGDVVVSMSGQTIEILNTDAEGRLILCDALTYSARFKPEVVVDIATLTGACVIALGGVASGLMANDDALAAELLESGQQAGDRAWQLPLWDEYQEQLKSNFADIPNIGSKGAGTITAACFLSRFTKDYRWAHLDIAGTAWKSGAEKGATGRPVPLLVQFLINRANPGTRSKRAS